MVTPLILVLELLAGCGGPLPTQRPLGGGRRYARPIDTLGVQAQLARNADSVWTALPSVYAELGLVVNETDQSARRLGACNQRVRGRLGKTLLSTVLDCGETNSFPNADRYEVTLTVLTSVRADPKGGALLATFVLGKASDPLTGSANPTWCMSTGSLEERVRRAVSEGLRG